MARGGKPRRREINHHKIKEVYYSLDAGYAWDYLIEKYKYYYEEDTDIRNDVPNIFLMLRLEFGMD